MNTHCVYSFLLSCVELIFKKGYYRFHIITFVHLSDVSFQWCDFRIKKFLTYFLSYDQFVFFVGSTSSHGSNVVIARFFIIFTLYFLKLLIIMEALYPPSIVTIVDNLFSLPRLRFVHFVVSAQFSSCFLYS